MIHQKMDMPIFLLLQCSPSFSIAHPLFPIAHPLISLLTVLPITYLAFLSLTYCACCHLLFPSPTCSPCHSPSCPTTHHLSCLMLPCPLFASVCALLPALHSQWLLGHISCPHVWQSHSLEDPFSPIESSPACDDKRMGKKEEGGKRQGEEDRVGGWLRGFPEEKA
jgi:hypothetical protein